jgi:hypothetical protein
MSSKFGHTPRPVRTYIKMDDEGQKEVDDVDPSKHTFSFKSEEITEPPLEYFE